MKIPKLDPGCPVRVLWDDAGSPGDQHWLTPAEIADQHHITTLGFYMKQTKRYFTVAQTTSVRTDGTFEYGNPFSIPPGCIRKITKL